eukprot:Gb_05822 [translate_table: standard]
MGAMTCKSFKSAFTIKFSIGTFTASLCMPISVAYLLIQYNPLATIVKLGKRKYFEEGSFMVKKKKPSCGQDEQHNIHSGSLIEDLPGLVNMMPSIFNLGSGGSGYRPLSSYPASRTATSR